MLPRLRNRQAPLSQFLGIHVKRDSWVSVMYAEELNASKSSVTLQRTDRHGSMGQKSADFQWSWCQRETECATDGPPDGVFQKPCASSPAGEGTSRDPPGVLVVGNGRRPLLAHPPGRGDALYLRPHARRWGRNDQRVFRSSAP